METLKLRFVCDGKTTKLRINNIKVATPTINAKEECGEKTRSVALDSYWMFFMLLNDSNADVFHVVGSVNVIPAGCRVLRFCSGRGEGKSQQPRQESVRGAEQREPETKGFIYHKYLSETDEQ